MIDKNSANQFGAVVSNIIDNALINKGLKEGYIISKVGHMDATKRTVHQVHSLISSATPPIEMTFCPVSEKIQIRCTEHFFFINFFYTDKELKL